MKYFIVFLFLVFTFSCTLFIEIDPTVTDSIPRFLTTLHAIKWVHENIKYKTDIENYWLPEFYAAPTRTLTLGCGDCEDRAILLAWIIKDQFGIEMEFSVQENSEGRHLACYYKGDYYDPTIDRPISILRWGLVEIARYPYSYFLDRARSLK